MSSIHPEAWVHPTAIVEDGAQLARGVRVDAYSIVRAHVSLGENTRIGPHCVIEGHTQIGRDNHILQFCSLGARPQDKKYADEPTRLEIGDRNTIREFCTFNVGTVQDAGVTRLGHDNWIMAYVHLAHDVQVGNHTILANNASAAGHAHIGDWAILGGFTLVHQFVKIGAHAMTGMGSALVQDVTPFAMVQGNPAQLRSFNTEGLKRRGFSAQRLAAVKQMHRALFRKGLTLEQARLALAALTADYPEAEGDVALMLQFLDRSDRGITR